MRPAMVKIAGPTASKSGHTQSQYVMTVVTPDGSVRYLTWGSTVGPDELADAIKEAWAEHQKQLGIVPQQGGAAEDRPAPSAGTITESNQPAAEDTGEGDQRGRRAA